MKHVSLYFGRGTKRACLLRKFANGEGLFGGRRAILLSLPAVALSVICCVAGPAQASTSVSHGQTGASGNQLQSATKTNKLTDARDHFSCLYPASYVVDAAAASRWRKQAEARHATEHLVAWLTDHRNGANILVMVVPVRFSLEYISERAPTGMEDLFLLKFTAFGRHKFFFYHGGNQAVQHPDQFFYDLNGRILEFAFDGPYSFPYIWLPDPVKVGGVEATVLGSLKTSGKQASVARPGSFLYTNKQYGFQMTLNRAWSDYKVLGYQNSFTGVTELYATVRRPAGPVNPVYHPAGNRILLLVLGVQSAKTWERRRKGCSCAIHSAPGATLIGRRGSTVFSLERWNTADTMRARYHLVRVLESFKPLH